MAFSPMCNVPYTFSEILSINQFFSLNWINTKNIDICNHIGIQFLDEINEKQLWTLVQEREL